MQGLGVDPLNIARRIHAHRKRSENNRAQDGRNKDSHTKRPKEFSLQNPTLMHLRVEIAHHTSPLPRVARTPVHKSTNNLRRAVPRRCPRAHLRPMERPASHLQAPPRRSDRSGPNKCPVLPPKTNEAEI